MKFQKTIDLWADGVVDALEKGNLRLQKGQWIRCGQAAKSRFVQVKPVSRTIHAVHPKGEAGVSTKRFSEACKFW